MKLFELCLNEVFDTKIPVDNWSRDNNRLMGDINIDNEHFQVIIEIQHYNFQSNYFNFLNIAFAKIVDGKPSQELTINNKNSAKILGAIYNAIIAKTKELSAQYEIDAIVFVARDNVNKRMSIYNKMTSTMFNPFLVYKTDIPLPDGAKMTALFRDNIDPQLFKSFVEYVDTISKL